MTEINSKKYNNNIKHNKNDRKNNDHLFRKLLSNKSNDLLNKNDYCYIQWKTIKYTVLCFFIFIVCMALLLWYLMLYHPQEHVKCQPVTQRPNLTTINDIVMKERQDMIRGMAKEAWDVYSTYAWEHDAVCPNSGKLINMFGNDTGHMIVTSMPALLIMGLMDEYAQAKYWVENNFDLKRFSRYQDNANLIEHDYLGTFLSLSVLDKNDTSKKLFIQRSIELADVLQQSCNKKTRLPVQSSDLYNEWTSDNPIVPLVEMTSSLLEYSYLNQINESKYKKRVEAIIKFLKKVSKPNGLFMSEVNISTAQWSFDSSYLGPKSTFYSHIVKLVQQQKSLKGDGRMLIDIYRKAIKSLEYNHMFSFGQNKFLYASNINNEDANDTKWVKYNEYMELSSCSLPSTLAIGSKIMREQLLNDQTINQNEKRSIEYDISRHMQLAEELIETCHHEAISTMTGLPPKLFYFDLTQKQQQEIDLNEPKIGFRKFLFT